MQWQILRTAFHGHATLVLIGDPKQAIYAFRGADVVTYLLGHPRRRPPGDARDQLAQRRAPARALQTPVRAAPPSATPGSSCTGVARRATSCAGSQGAGARAPAARDQPERAPLNPRPGWSRRPASAYAWSRRHRRRRRRAARVRRGRRHRRARPGRSSRATSQCSVRNEDRPHAPRRAAAAGVPVVLTGTSQRVLAPPPPATGSPCSLRSSSRTAPASAVRRR